VCNAVPSCCTDHWSWGCAFMCFLCGGCN
jgi:hypothetical protein